MNPDFVTLRELAAQNDWLSLLPEMALGALAVLILFLELSLSPERRHWVARLVWMALAGLLFFQIGHAVVRAEEIVNARLSFNGLVRLSGMGEAARVFFLMAGLGVSYLGYQYNRVRNLPQVEFQHILLIILAAMMLLAQSHHFVLAFLSLEIITIGFYILVSYFRTESASLEGGLKYLIQGAFISALLLFGIVLLYGAAAQPGHAATAGDPFNFADLATFLTANPRHPLAFAGVFLILAGVFFKIGAVPFHVWIPDVYQGAPAPVTAALATASKGAGFFFFIALLRGPFAPLMDVLQPLLMATATVTLLYASLAALGQRKIKRLLGLSGIAHAGYLLLGAAAAVETPWVWSAMVYYLFIYLLASMAVFTVVTVAFRDLDFEQTIDHYQGLAKNRLLLAGGLAIGLGSLAGIPPLAGFIAKLLLLMAAFQARLYWGLGAALFGVAAGVYYYFGWIRAALFRPPAFADPSSTADLPPTPAGVFWILGGLSFLLILLGFYPGHFGGFIF